VITMELRYRPQWLVASCQCNVGVICCLMRRFIDSLLVVFYTWNLWYVYSSIRQVAVVTPVISIRVCVLISVHNRHISLLLLLLYIYKYFRLAGTFNYHTFLVEAVGFCVSFLF